MAEVNQEIPQRVLVVTPHPDDAEIWCGGALAHWISRGAEVHYVLCTDGGNGTTDPNVTSQQLSAVREQEQRDAAHVLGAVQVVLLHHPDGELEDTSEFRKEIVRQIRLVRPDVVLCPEPYRRNLAWHRDHRITGQVTLDAVFPAARDHLNFVELWRTISLREQEQRDAAHVLGAVQVVLLHHPDGELEDTSEFRKEIVRQIRLVRPDVVLCPEPYRRNLAWHRDHRITGQVTLDAVFPAARDHLNFVELWRDEGLEPHKTGTVLLWGTELADMFVDISDAMDAKVEALMANRSQIGDRSETEVRRFVEERARDAGKSATEPFQLAEAFRKVTFRT